MIIIENGVVRELTPEEELEYAVDEPSYKEKIVREIRTKYSVDDEIAILRQRDTKPEEFKEYFEFVENIKQNIKDS